MIHKTKKKIILSAIELFNEEGILNVRNQDIAKKTGISLSNFNYHYSSRKDLIRAVIRYISTLLKEHVYDNALLISDIRGVEIVRRYFEFVQNFRFVYLDTHNILQTHPDLKKEIKRQIEEAIQMIKNINYIAIGKGYMKPPPDDYPELYDHLAEQIWVSNHFWFAQAQLQNIQGELVEKGLQANFAISYPYLTEKGRASLNLSLKKTKQ